MPIEAAFEVMEEPWTQQIIDMQITLQTPKMYAMQANSLQKWVMLVTNLLSLLLSALLTAFPMTNKEDSKYVKNSCK